MNLMEKLDIVSRMTGESPFSSKELEVYLDMAAEAIIRKAYPFETDTKPEMPNKYDYLQCEIAAFLWNKKGAEGQTSHSENGISRSYENGYVPDSMLKNVTSFCKAVV